MKDEEERARGGQRQALQLCLLLVVLSIVVVSVVVALAVTSAWSRRHAAEARAALERAEHEALRAVNQALEERARTAEFQERFIAVLGHDLRAPLTAMTFGIAALKRGAASTPALERMGSSAARMNRMIEQLLDLARARLGGGVRLARAPADLGRIAFDAIDELEAAHPGRTVEVRKEGSLDGCWDRDRLARVVSNLVGNAICHGAADTPVRVKLAGDASHVRLAVSNHGPPIPEELRPVLFEPFRHAGREGGRAAGSGLGLGLYIAKSIVVAHGGDIEVASSEPSTTTFLVTLPRREADAPDDLRRSDRLLS
jgi:signal transduction histidine kinase